MQIDTLLHRLKPSGHRDCPQLHGIRTLTAELQTLIDAAHAAIAPEDLGKNQLVEWSGHAPLELEYFEGPRGDCQFVGFRVRGVEIPCDYFGKELVAEAESEVASWRGAREAEAREVHADYLNDLRRDRQAEREAA